jgi:hypothetical protein
MTLVLADRVLETATSPGTGAVSLLGATTGYQSFLTGVGNGNTTYYAIVDQAGANWEVGLGTYNSTGSVLTRTTPLSGSAATPVNFVAGTQNVFVAYPAEKAVYQGGPLSATSVTTPIIESATTLQLQTNGTTTAVTIDALQNVGIGVTPSTWTTGTNILQIGSKSSLWQGAGGGINVSNNYYITSGGVYTYLTTGYASLYSQSNGTHAWSTAPSGTAGTTATFTTVMSLDASGNLLLTNGTQVLNGSTTVFAAALTNAKELVNIIAAAPAATQNIYFNLGAVQYCTTTAANNFVLNFAMSAGTALNTAMAVGDSATFAFKTVQGTTAYYCTSITVDGTATGVTTKWVGGAPIAGNASGWDYYTGNIIKTASATYDVAVQLSQAK